MASKVRAIFSQRARSMALSAADTAAEGPSRRMRWPYTMSAKMAQFPFKMYYDKAPLTHYLILGFVCSWPLFIFFQRMARSPENIKKWDDIHEASRNHPKVWEEEH
ncbi:uncharacterized protein roh [Bemisia tabaci]|uniref:uncharacterized protein roh n=1 Tax=Bemisia tabaci TaxID=7038 RepID=UPI003B27DB90